MDAQQVFLIGTLDVIKKAGYVAELSKALDYADKIKVSFTWHDVDDDCTLTYIVSINDREISMLDMEGGPYKAWPIEDPKCFDYLLEELRYLQLNSDAMREWYPEPSLFFATKPRLKVSFLALATDK